MSSARDTLMEKLLNDETPALTPEEHKILQNALTLNLPELKNGLNTPQLRILLRYYVPQAGIYRMKRAELIKKLKIHFTALLDLSPPRRRSLSPQRRRSLSPQRRRSLSPQRIRSLSPQRRSSLSPQRRSSLSPPASVAPVPPDAPPALPGPVDIFNGLNLPQHLVIILDRYSIPPPRIEGKFVNEIALDGGPLHVACHAGKAYVTHDGKMSVLDVESLALVDEWTIPGATGVAVRGEHVFVADYEKHCIRVLDMEGKQERQFGTYGSGIGQFKSPEGVAIAGELLYVCDYRNHRVQVFGLDGTWVRSWGSEGAGEGQFNNPVGITVHDDEVYVCDELNHRVQVFDLDGTFRRMWGSEGTGDGELDGPCGVIVHGELVYVTECTNDRVQSFGLSDGEFVGSWGAYGSAFSVFELPLGVCVDDRGRLWVCDTGNHRLQLFR